MPADAPDAGAQPPPPQVELRAEPLQASSAADGTFGFPAVDGSFWLLASGDAGTAAVKVEAQAPPQQHVLKLRPYGRVEGVLVRGAKPLAGETVSCFSNPGGDEKAMLVQYREQARTDTEGRFAFERVPPGAHQVGHMIVRRVGRGRTFTSSHAAPANVRSRETTKVTIGGTGRPVLGTFQSDVAVDWSRVHGALAFDPGDGGGTREYVVLIDPDGSFRAEDVPEGKYSVSIVATPFHPPGPSGAPPTFAPEPAHVEIPAMPGGRSDEPLAVGRIKVSVE